MKKLLVTSSIAAVLGLTGCGGETVQEQNENTPNDKPYVRVVFDPATSNLNIPNDLLMVPSGDLFDFTLNTEGNAPFNPANPQHALSMLDGWSTSHPFQIRVTLTSGIDVNPSTVGPDSIRLFEATQALEGTSATCQALAEQLPAPGVPCELGQELQYGVDFVASYTAGSGAISVVPLKPLKSAQGHMLVVTSKLKDTEGKPVWGSSTWELARQDIDTLPLSSPEQLQLQGLVNSLVNVLKPLGLETVEVSYAAYFSTQSTTSLLATAKQLQIGPFAQALQGALASGSSMPAAQQFAAQYLPAIVTHAPLKGETAFEYLAPVLLSAEKLAQLQAVGLDTCAGLMATLAEPSSPLYATAQQTFATAGPLCAVKRVEGTVNLPYYLNPTNPLGDWWRAACTNGAMLKALGAQTVGSLIQSGAVGENNALCQAASDGQLYDLNLASLGIDDPRNITKFSPIPVARGRNLDNPNTLYNEAGTETLNVQFTIPDEGVIAALSAATGGAISAITKPVEGWPVVVFQHGITGQKENVLAMSAALSLAGFASVAIDHPLHGERAITLASGEVVDASSVVTNFMNLQSLLTARDNSRQSIIDTMGLRLALNAIVDTTGSVSLNTQDVHFIGQSLGAITGTSTVGLANASLPENLASLNPMYRFNSAVINVPAGGIVSFLMVSPNFSALIRGSLLAASSDAFVQYLTQYSTTNQIPLNAALAPAYTAYAATLSVEQMAALNVTFASFEFAAQTVMDSADPINFSGLTAANGPVLVQLAVGGGVNDDGSTAITDQVNSVNVPNRPLAGGNALAHTVMGLPDVSSTTQGSGVVSFIAGGHPSLLTPSPSQAATNEMQKQAIAFFKTDGQTIVISDTTVVAN